MIRKLLLVAALCVGLALLERALDAPAHGEVALAAQPRRLVPEARARDMTVAALSLEFPGSEERFIYAQRDGVWRCMNAHGALALDNAVTSLAGELVGAVGELRSDDPARQRAYGFDGVTMITVALHGPRVLTAPDGDRLVAFDLGSVLPGAGDGRVFARPVGTSEVYELGSNPRALLDRPAGDRLPPLLDRRVMAGDFPGPGEGVVRAFVDWHDGRALELIERVSPPERVLPGRAAREWVALRDGEESFCLPFRIAAWQGFMFRVGYTGFADAERRAELGFADGHVVRLTLFLSDGTATALSVGRRSEDGAAFVWNEKTGMLCRVAPEHVALFAPSLEMLSDPDIVNPWEAWLSGRR